MNRAIAHLQKSIRETEAKIENLSSGYAAMKRETEARFVELEEAKALLAELRGAVRHIPSALEVIAAEPAGKKKRA